MAAPAALPDAKPDLMDGAQQSQNRGLMDKNRIEGRHGASKGHSSRENEPGAGCLILSV